MSTTTPSGLYPGPPGHLCIPRSSVFLAISCPRSSAMLWCGVKRAVTITLLGLGRGNHADVTRADLSLPRLGAHQQPWPPHVCILGFHSLSICPKISLSTQRGLSSTHRTPALVCLVRISLHFLLRTSDCPWKLPFSLCPSSGEQILTQCLFTHPTLLYMYLSYSSGCSGVLLSISS